MSKFIHQLLELYKLTFQFDVFGVSFEHWGEFQASNSQTRVVFIF